ncbi:hypothetical protein SAMN02745824_2651 [Parasphingorhabdus marina DSM 22363]|uniref:Uncharacterized protein n=1 Tax=Parasphingorhabdus marina DSM 22363 TaxID=1123272 RepID=A0A1N6G2R9_9SPHN|nr:hypothetical protein [Parasphingorhabdus marina]SIO01835.1 hypothetical protein SAMN02745824_2651 [Parasphingorhabdus marina DSM 22363]
MENERVILAIGRIERALSRIENAQVTPPQMPVDDGLEQRHEALKLEMQEAIRTIDGLIAKQEN